MSKQKQTVLITGGSSGIGAGLARAFHSQGAKVVIAGRDKSRLDALAVLCPGMGVMQLDVSNSVAVYEAANIFNDNYGGLDTLVNCAGIQQLLDFRDAQVNAADIALEIDINFKGLVWMSAAFLPLLSQSPSARLVQVSSALAYVPLIKAPLYSATKAAIHSFCITLREQLRGKVQVVELIPPVVETGLHRNQPTKPPQAMKLDAFVKAAMRGLEGGDEEINVGLAQVLRIGSRVAPDRFLSIINRAAR